MTRRHALVGLLALALAACTSETGSDTGANGAKTGANGAKGGKSSILSSNRTAASGTTVTVTIRDEITSLHNVVGQELVATMAADVLDAKGRVVVPAGSPVALHISAISPAKAGETTSEGTLELTVTSITVNGATHNEHVVVRNIPHTMQGRGVTKGVVEDVAVGTAVGAVIGQVIGKNPKGTIIGGAVGAVAGGAVAVAGAQRDIVTAAGTHISFSLPQSITVASR